MSKIESNYFYNQPIMNNQFKNEALSANYYTDNRTLNDEFIMQHKKNGLFEKLYNQIKNITGLGTGSKKVKEAIEKSENNEITQEEAEKTIDKYRKSQANSEQVLGDFLSIGAAGRTYFKFRKQATMWNAEASINEKYYKELYQRKSFNNFIFKIQKSLHKSKTKTTIALTTLAALTGGIVKWASLFLNRVFVSDEFKTRKKDYNGAVLPDDKFMYNIDKKTKRSEGIKANFRNFASGAINGLMLPITTLGGAFVGVPAYFVGNSLNRYFVGNHVEKDKSFNSYIENLKNDSITHGALVAATAVPMAKKARFNSVLNKNLKTVIDKLKDKNLAESGFEGKTIVDELDDILVGSKEIKSILDNIDYKDKDAIANAISKLSDENIFAVKFLQIRNNKSNIVQALRENCPETYTLEEATEFIKNALGEGYTVRKLLGVGTIAETYLAKDKSGKDVCIKILKKGIDEEKILRDKEKFIEIVKNLEGKSSEEIEILLKNIDNLAEGIKNEVNFVNEMEAAKKLAKVTKSANVVKPIEVKNGVYVMEKAEGISLQSLAELNALQSLKTYYEKRLKNEPEIKELILKNLERINKQIEHTKSRMPDFDDAINLTTEDSNKILHEYMKVYTEQFVKLEKDGKILHADIHPGNIFINLKALRKGNGKLFTLIDTGNTVTMNKEQSLRALKLTSIVQRGSTQDIAEYALDGAKLPEGLTKEKAIELVKKDLDKCFFDTETKLEAMNNSTILDLTSNILKKYNIIQNDTQLNFNKARKSANNSLFDLIEILFNKKYGSFDYDTASKTERATTIGSAVITDLKLAHNFKEMLSKQEKLNLKLLDKAERKKYKNNPNLLKENDEKYLIYKLKQKLKDISRIPKEGSENV